MTTGLLRPEPANPADPDGASRAVLEHSTGRWGALTLAALLDGPLRFAQLARAVRGISDRMLVQTLQRLETHGLVSRRPHPTTPLRVDYALTDLGRPIALRIRDLIDTIHDQLPGIIAHHHSAPSAPGESS